MVRKGDASPRANVIYPRATIHYQCRELHIGNYCGRGTRVMRAVDDNNNRSRIYTFNVLRMTGGGSFRRY